MPWNPEKYNQFKEIRYQPFFDLKSLVSERNLKSCIDIGCGTGEQTKILADAFHGTSFLGIDSSAEMLSLAKQFESDKLEFRQATIEEFVASESVWDLIFSNAALQWADNHHTLFPLLISKLNKDGQFAVQMPFQKENMLNKILLEMVQENPFSQMLDGFVRSSPVLAIDEYAKMMFDNSLRNITLFLKVYPIIAKDAFELYSFISGSALIPYMEKLSPKDQELFKVEYLKRIDSMFKKYPSIYSFKRILMYGGKE